MACTSKQPMAVVQAVGHICGTSSAVQSGIEPSSFLLCEPTASDVCWCYSVHHIYVQILDGQTYYQTFSTSHSTIILVFWYQKSKLEGSPKWGTKFRWGRKIPYFYDCLAEQCFWNNWRCVAIECYFFVVMSLGLLMLACFCCIGFSFFCTKQSDCEECLQSDLCLCRLWHETLNQSVL